MQGIKSRNVSQKPGSRKNEEEGEVAINIISQGAEALCQRQNNLSEEDRRTFLQLSSIYDYNEDEDLINSLPDPPSNRNSKRFSSGTTYSHHVNAVEYLPPTKEEVDVDGRLNESSILDLPSPPRPGISVAFVNQRNSDDVIEAELVSEREEKSRRSISFDTAIFDEVDSDSNMVYSASPEPPHIVAATLPKLIEQLTASNGNAGEDFLSDFFFAYRFFATAENLLELLLLRLRWAYQKEHTFPVRQQTYKVITYWLTNHFEVDFQVNQILRAKLVSFAKETLRNPQFHLLLSDETFIESIQTLLATGGRVPGTETTVPALEENSVNYSLSANSLSDAVNDQDKSTSNSGLYGWMRFYFQKVFSSSRKSVVLEENAKIISKQLCLIEQRYFCAIRWTELLHLGWTKMNNIDKTNSNLDQVDILATNVRACIARSNLTTRWAASEILRAPDADQAAKVLQQFITIAMSCLKLRCYSAVVEIVLALANPMVERASKVWKRISISASKDYKSLLDFTSPLGNMKKLRAAMKTGEGKPCVPFVGVYLQDLTVSAELDDFLTSGGLRMTSENRHTSPKLIHYYKHWLTSNKIKAVLEFQHPKYLYHFKVSALNPELIRLETLSDASLAELSVKWQDKRS